MAKRVLETSALLYPAMVALVTSQDSQARPNVMTVSWGGILRTYPPMVGISIQRTRFSHPLIRESGEFVINLPDESLLYAVDYCGWASGKDVDKFQETSLTPIPSLEVGPPAIEQCVLNLECVVKQTIPLDPYDLFLAEVVATRADELVLLPGAEGAEMIAFKPVLDLTQSPPLAYVPGTAKYSILKHALQSIFFSKHCDPDSLKGSG